MKSGLLLVCDECIELSEDINLLRFDDKWQMYDNGKLLNKLWCRAIHVCKGLGLLIDDRDKIGLIWEDGTFKKIRNYGSSELFREINDFIIEQVGVKGLSDRAFIGHGTGIITKTKYRSNILGIRDDVKLNVFKSKGGWEIYRYNVFGGFYYGVLNKEKTGWLVDINCGYEVMRYTPSGVMIFSYAYTRYEDKNGGHWSKTHLVYNQEDIVKPFCGRLTKIDTQNDIYQYKYDGDKGDDEAQPLVIGDREYTYDCLVRITTSGVELVTELPEKEDKVTILGSRYGREIKYYSSGFMLWGKEMRHIDGYRLESDKHLGILCGYALNDKGQYHFNKNIIIVVQEYIKEGLKDILAYCEYKGIERKMIITPELGKVVGIGLDDIVYREEGGWLKIVSPEQNVQRYYYNGQVYENMRLAYKRCEKVPTHGWIGQSLYACQHMKGNWIIGTQDMEPIGRRGSAWYESKEEVVELIRDMVELSREDYLRYKVGICKESKQG